MVRAWVVAGAAVNSVARTSAAYQREADLILEILHRCDAGLAGEPVATPRLFGVDSAATQWSVYGIVDYLMQFQEWTMSALLNLHRQQSVAPPYGPFVPDDAIGSECIDRWQEHIWHYVSLIVKLETLAGSQTAKLPWPGSFTAKQWHYFSYCQTRLYRRQIQKILAISGVV